MQNTQNTTVMLRKKNMLEILKIVRNNPMISRPEIAKKARLTSVTVSTLIAELMDRNIVIEGGLADSQGGRKAQLYHFNKDAGKIIGINMRIGFVTVELYDLVGNRIATGESFFLDDKQKVEETTDRMVDAVHKILSANALKAEDILGIGVTMPGRVDHERGIVYHLPNLRQWHDVPLKEWLENALNIQTFIDRDTNSNVMYLKWEGVLEECSDLVYLSIDEGIGSGVLIDDAVYHGSHGLAGEVGHMTVEPDGPLCNCGNRGCIEVFTSNQAIVKYYRDELAKSGKGTEECDRILGNHSAENKLVVEMAKMAEAGDREADNAFHHAVKYLKALIINIINTYDVSMVVVECSWMKEAKRYFNEMVSGVYDRVQLIKRSDIKIVLNQVAEVFSKSPYIVVIERLFTDLDDNILIH